MRVHLADRGGLSSAEGLQELFRLALELVEVGVLAERASGKRLVHDELLSWLTFTSAAGPVSARSGRKEFNEPRYEPSTSIRGTQSFPRTRRRPNAPQASYHDELPNA